MREFFTTPTEAVTQPPAFTVPYTQATDDSPRQTQTLNRAARARGKGRRT